MPVGQRHLIGCRCVLQHFKSRSDPPRHHFMVFSVINDDDTIATKFVQCNNCGLIHKIIDICKSEILSGKENSASVMTIDEIKVSLPKNLIDILERSNVDISIYEQAQFILENKRWGDVILLTAEEDGGIRHGKYVRILGETFFKVDNFSRQEIL